MTETQTVHVFERAGLGKAPFRFIGIEERRGPLPVEGHPGMFVGAPGQPMGTCQYCGEGIAECCVIKSSDGRVFIVGNVCVGKTGDAGLKKVVAAAIRERRTEATHRRQDAKIETGRSILQRPGVADTLRAEKHPYVYQAERGLTLLDWAEWMLKNAGRKGMCEVASYLQRRFGEAK